MTQRHYLFRLNTTDEAKAHEIHDLMRSIFSPMVMPNYKVGEVKLSSSTNSDLPEELGLEDGVPDFDLIFQIDAYSREAEEQITGMILSELKSRGMAAKLSAVRDSIGDIHLHFHDPDLAADSNMNRVAGMRQSSETVAKTVLPLEPVESAGLRLWIDPGDALPETIADVLRALSDLHVAAGGSGLKFSVDEDESHIVINAEELT